MAYSKKMTYKGYIIQYDPPPIGDRRLDYSFYHKDYDGAEDSGDPRCGLGASAEDCVNQIEDIENELKGAIYE